MAFIIMTMSIVSVSIMTLNISDIWQKYTEHNSFECCYADFHYVECCDYLNAVMLSVIMLNVAMLNDVALKIQCFK
jgi:hypothetical protein